MEIRINPPKFNIITPFNNLKPETRKENINTNYSNSMTLPNFEVYKGLSFGKQIKFFSPQDFLLPSNCYPDKYQTDAAISISKGNNTIVTAPTGTGKTAIAHFAVKKNFENGKKTFYTTPLKALSNQKYNDLKKLFGKENVGIMTGDRKENTQAPIIVMTTEIYRNVVSSNYFGKQNDLLNNLKTVIFDEFHYMGDSDRGSVWEESIMFSPKDIQILALSATVGNNKRITHWLNSTKEAHTDLINVPAENRHVPLEFVMYSPKEKTSNGINQQQNLSMRYLTKSYYDSKLSDSKIKALNELALLMGFKASNKGRKTVIEILRDQYKLSTVSVSEIQDFLKENYEIPKSDSRALLLKLTDKKAIPINTQGRVIRTLNKTQRNPNNVIKLLNSLQEDNKLPAIVFVFSKKYSDELLKTATNSGKILTNQTEQKAILDIIEKYKEEHGFFATNLNMEALLKGYAIHSAAILPLQKQLIEELFNKKLIKVAFATETLAAGINMPARTVVMTDYQKPNGEFKTGNSKLDFLRNLTANEFHQMSGRAGRRGIDKIGYVYLLNDSPEKEVQFEKLINAEPNNISSALNIDASFVANFYDLLSDPNDITRILAKSFSIYEDPKDNKHFKLKKLVEKFNDYTALLYDYGFLDSENKGFDFKTNSLGELLSAIKGKPQIPIIETIINGRFDNVSDSDFAGLIAGIAANSTHYDSNEPLSFDLTETPQDELDEINNELNYILETFMQFDKNEINAQRTNDEILSAINKKFKDTLEKELADINEQRDIINAEIKRQEKLINNAYDLDNAQYKNYVNLRNISSKLREEKLLLTRTNRIKILLEKRLSLQLQKQFSNNIENENTKYEAYNKIRKDFIRYNKVLESYKTELPQITLNQTAFLLVNKWAELNKNNTNYNENWEEVCKSLKEAGALKYEGDLFNAIAQTIDFLNQLDGMFVNAIKSEIYPEKTNDFNQLHIKCKNAIKLLKTPPLYSTEEI